MELTIHGKQIDVGDALRTHVTKKMEDLCAKYFNHTTFSTVTFSREGHGHPLTRAHIMIQLGKNIMIVADATEADPYISFESSLDKAAKQLRRYKHRLRDHHERLEKSPETEILKARDYVLALQELEHTLEDIAASPATADTTNNAQDNDPPVVIAEMATEIQTMSVSDAVMRMDLSSQPALLFRNASHFGINLVYRRPDGHVGWVDPENITATKTLKRA
jgi:ribosomal subunit interface protein